MLRAIERLVQYMLALGILDGVKLFSRVHFSNGIFSVNMPGFQHPIYLRQGTSDQYTFLETLILQHYDFDVDMEAPKTIIDAGANIGLTSLYYAKKYPDARILAIEPDSENYQLLVKNCGGYENIDTMNCALWSQQASLHISNPDASVNAYIVDEISDHVVSDLQAISIHQVMEWADGQIDHLKLDIEGAEKELFSMADLSWLSSVKAIAIETHDRIIPGTSKLFYDAIHSWEFNQEIRGNNILVVKTTDTVCTERSKSARR